MEENEIIKDGNTNKILINFIIDVPYFYDDSIINTIILGINQYVHIKNDINVSQKQKNELLMNIQRELDNLIVLDD